MTYWRKNGKLVVDTSGRPVRCNTCPCDSPPPGDHCMPCCSSAPNQWVATLPTGFTNGANCNRCTTLNGASFVLTHAGHCRWTYDEPHFCPSCRAIDFELFITFTLTADFSNHCVANLQLQLIGPDDSPCLGDIVTWQKIYISPAAFSCGGSNSIPYASAFTDGPACSGYPTGPATVVPG